jgi:hypothetical protein
MFKDVIVDREQLLAVNVETGRRCLAFSITRVLSVSSVYVIRRLIAKLGKN